MASRCVTTVWPAKKRLRRIFRQLRRCHRLFHAYKPDGENLLPVLLGREPPHARTLYWRYKANKQRAVRQDNWKYLKIADNEFLFDVTQDQRERANLAEKNPDIFAQLKQQWEAWNATMLPITDDVHTYSVAGKDQADRYRALEAAENSKQKPQKKSADAKAHAVKSSGKQQLSHSRPGNRHSHRTFRSAPSA